MTRTVRFNTAESERGTKRKRTSDDVNVRRPTRRRVAKRGPSDVSKNIQNNTSIWTRGRKREQGLGDVDDDEVTSNLLREKMEQDLPKELNVTQELFQKFVLAFRRVPDGPE